MKTSYVKDMTTGKPTGLILMFMLPMVIGNVFQQLYNMVDSMIVGQVVGADALAAVGATGSLNFLFFSLCGGMANGIGVVLSQYFGAGNKDKVKQTIANAVYIMAVVGVFMGVLGALLSRPVLTFLKTPDNILDDAVLYMRIMCLGVLAVAFYNCISAILRAVGDSKTPLYFLIVASILNVVLDILFVKSFGMGIAGAGIATIISQLLSAAGSLIFAMYRNPFFKIEKNLRKHDFPIIWQCTRMGVPLALQTSLIAISCVILQSVVNTFGATVMAAFTATSRIEQLVQQPFNSLGMAISTYTGQNIGAGKVERVRQGYRRGMMLMAAFALLMIPMAQFGGEHIMRMFVNEEEVIAFGAEALKITSWFYLFLGTIYVTRGLLNGVGDAVFAFGNGVVEVLGRICLAKPLTMIPVVGVWGIWLATGLTWMFTGIFSAARYLQGKWKMTAGGAQEEAKEESPKEPKEKKAFFRESNLYKWANCFHGKRKKRLSV
ncbi:MAG: MATE family efflux transporter [Lachnospiraceae bacterium]|nr:MATE family efflux transporter [Lachnospiraceae bacterium]